MEELQYKILKSLEKEGSIVLSIIPVGIIILIAFLIICL